jgi:hypothetical protein
MTRVRQLPLLLRPTARVVGWGPPLWAAIPAAFYVWTEAPGEFVDYRVQVLRFGALLLCMASAFILDDPTEETIGHVPTPLLLRRGLRVALVLPFLALVWVGLVLLAGHVTIKQGGPLPVGDLTIEAATMLAIALCAACVGARLTSDRLGGVVAAPIVLACVALAMFLPPHNKLLVPSVSDPRWDRVHDLWMFALIGCGVLFLLVNRSPGRSWRLFRFRTTKPARVGSSHV